MQVGSSLPEQVATASLQTGGVQPFSGSLPFPNSHQSPIASCLRVAENLPLPDTAAFSL